MSNIYVVALSYQPEVLEQSNVAADDVRRNFTFPVLQNAATVSAFEVRASYFGVCITSRDATWQCATDTSLLISHSTPETDPLGLLEMTRKVKDEVIFPGFL